MPEQDFKQNDPSMPAGGPQFGLEENEGWISKYGGSVILPIIALLILAGGIYLYASQQSDETETILEEEDISIIDDEFPDLEEIIEEEESDIVVVPEPQIRSGNIIETAAVGEGVTHLARRALKHYTEHPQQATLTNEHKIYIEDYLKDKTGSQSLEIGEEVSFSEDLIHEAIDASLSLTSNQLENLEQYSALVVW